MTKPRIFKVALAVLATAAIGTATSAKADNFLDYTVDGIFDGSGTVAGSFDVDATTNAVTAVDLAISAFGGVTAFTATDPSKFTYFLYTGKSFYNLATEDYAGHNLYLGFDRNGGTLASSGFGSSAVQQYFGPSYSISGTIVAQSGEPSAVPENSSWALLIAGFAIVGGALRLGRWRNAAFVSSVAWS